MTNTSFYKLIALGLLLAVFLLGAGAAMADPYEEQFALNAGLQALNTRTDLAISQTNGHWSYTDKVGFANFIKLFHADMTQTLTKQHAPGKVYRGMTWKEENPTLEPIADNAELMRVYEALLSALLGKRWSELKDPGQRTLEIIAANLVEIKILNYSQEGWSLALGFDF